MSEIELKDGQIYRWCFKDVSGSMRDPYWCKSNIAIVINGKLRDTFWGTDSSNFCPKADEVDLTYMGDIGWPTIQEYQVPYYAREDICDTRHSNSSGAKIYLRPGAQRNKDRMLEEIEWREGQAKSEINMATSRLGWLKTAREQIEAGKIDEVSL